MTKTGLQDTSKEQFKLHLKTGLCCIPMCVQFLFFSINNRLTLTTFYFFSHVHAAYASFLWETEDEDEDDDTLNDSQILPPTVHRGAMASATA